jgi:phospholipid transport system substrate-binding protein
MRITMGTRPKKTWVLKGLWLLIKASFSPVDNIWHKGTTMILTKRQLLATITLMAASVFTPLAQAEDEAPDALIKRLSVDVLDAIKADKAIRTGDIDRVIALVDTRIMPNVNFQRMTASAVGPAWRQATPEQQKRLQDEFKTLLVRTYAGALAEVSDQTISMKPFRASSDDKEVVVRTEVRGRGDPIQLDYRLEKTPGMGAGWKIYNLNVLGVWLVETYRSQFAQQINAKGLDGLINVLVDQNKANAKKA